MTSWFMLLMATVVVIVLAALVVWAVTTSVQGRLAIRRQRLEILQDALQRPDLDQAARREILDVLREEHARRPLAFLRSPRFWSRAVFVTAWLAFVFFGGLALLHATGLVYTPYEVTLLPCIVALGVLALPAALGELRRREHAAASHR